MTPIVSYKVGEQNIRHAMDLSTDKIHVYSSKDDVEKEIYTFDSSCYMRDEEGKLLGKIYLEDNCWVFRNLDDTKIIRGYSFKDVDGVLKTEALAVADYLGIKTDELPNLTRVLRRM